MMTAYCKCFKVIRKAVFISVEDKTTNEATGRLKTDDLYKIMAHVTTSN
jgi:hypothetical protein